MQVARLSRSRSLLDWLDRQPDRVCWPLGLALGTIPSLGMMLVSPTAGLIACGVTLGAAVWLGLTGNPIALPVAELPEPLAMIELPGGEFWMGEGTERHRVRVSAFSMGKYPVTQKQYQEVMGENPSYFRGKQASEAEWEDQPVEQLSWFDAVRFCNRLSARQGRKPCYRIIEPEAGLDAQPGVEWDQMADGYRLPTEAEWEYACRAGTETAYSFGNDAAQLGEHAWFGEGIYGRPHAVGQKKPNGWGLHDLHGNVWDWCWDWYGNYDVTNVDDKSVKLIDPIGPPSGIRRVLRGGSFADERRFLRSAGRDGFEPVHRLGSLGFRCVRGARSSGLGLTRATARD